MIDMMISRWTRQHQHQPTQAALEKVEKAMASAKEATSGMLEPDSDDEEDSSGLSTRRPSMMGAPAAVTEEDLAPLVAAAKKARAAGSTAPQVTEWNGMGWDGMGWDGVLWREHSRRIFSPFLLKWPPQATASCFRGRLL